MRSLTLGLLSVLAALPSTMLSAAPGPVQVAQPADDRPDIVLGSADRDLAIQNLLKTVREHHYSAREGGRIAAKIAQFAKSGRYSSVTSGRALARLFTSDLRSVSGDQHFLVDYFFRARPFPAPAEADEGPRLQEFALTNFGVARADRLDGNIGYLRIDKFGPTDGAGPVLQNAMQLLSATDALIIDLRWNGGGYAPTAAFLAGQLLPEPTRMSDLRSRTETRQLWTPTVLGGRYVDKPVYVLTSSKTFSAAEGFAYDLRALGRVKIVGERSRGGANPVNRVLLSSRFWMLVPVAQALNPITGTNWEGTGVRPDIPVAADRALEVAQRDAAQQLLAKHRDDPLTHELLALTRGPAGGS